MNSSNLGTARKSAVFAIAMVLALAVSTIFAAAPAPVVGDWNGALSAGGTTLRIVVHVTQGADGKLAGTLDSPDQGASGIVMSAISFTAPDLHFEIQQIGGTYDGKIDKDNAQISGAWKQGGNELPLALKRAAKP